MEEKPIIETRLVKHTYSSKERLEFGAELARSVSAVTSVEKEFDGVKASYKAKLTEAQSTVQTISANLQNGFDMRPKRCKVVYRPKDKQKDYYPEVADGLFEAKPALTEEMTQEDFQTDLFQSERPFERRMELALFKDGLLIVGRLGGKWHAALRVRMGQQKIEERLEATGKKFKARADAIKATAKRCEQWIADQFGDETAKGFRDSIAKVVKEQEPLEE